LELVELLVELVELLVELVGHQVLGRFFQWLVAEAVIQIAVQLLMELLEVTHLDLVHGEPQLETLMTHQLVYQVHLVLVVVVVLVFQPLTLNRQQQMALALE
jgi:hypothetical protein